MFRKLNVSASVQRWLKLSIIVVGLLWLFHILTGFSGFLFAAYGYCAGCVINSIHEFVLEIQKKRAFDIAEEKLSSENTNEKEVNENDL